MFESNAGRIIGDNPYYIYEYLRLQNNTYDCFWGKRKNTYVPESVEKTTKYHTISYVFIMMTSKVIVCDSGFPTYIPFREKQVLINTWHGGGAYKKVGVAINELGKNLKFLRRDAFRLAKYTTYFLSSSRKFTDVMAETNFIDKKKYLPIGMPRNDMFFNTEQIKETNKNVRKKLKILDDEFVILYAPTYRGNVNLPNFNDTQIDIDSIKKVVGNKFRKKVVFCIRMHPDLSLDVKKEFPNIDMDVSTYPFMQELLCAADMLITDYSSSIWDFSFTNKPGFLFVPDLEKYETNRGFYTPISTWSYMYAKTNEELVENIQNWTLEFQVEKNRMHHEFLGNYENGYATEKICKVIEEKLKR